MLGPFINFCKANLAHSFAQNYQDLFALFATGGRTDGYFVEFGALNGRSFSNTYLLEKLGWKGIVAEPHPDYAEHIRANRSCHFSPLCVYDTTGATVTFRTVTGRPALSGVADTQLTDEKSELRGHYRETQVETTTLNDLLDAYDAPDIIDFISIDTEGSEERILKAFDFGPRRISTFCVEHNYIQREALAEIFEANGYRRILETISGHDDWWVARDLKLDSQSADFLASTRFSEVFDQGLDKRRKLLLDLERRLAGEAERR